ncbi:MAG: hypothetical protein J7M18_03900, partial [Candidatus Eremiobacteraeota bacterium]|nr:hypothetical protein [Candidatus Eremiobacteraeota bacterium]
MKKHIKMLQAGFLVLGFLIICIQAGYTIKPDDYLREYFRKTRVLTPRTYRNLTIFPVQGPGGIYK